MKIKQLICNHENSVVLVRLASASKNIVIGSFCLKCYKFWLRDDIDKILKEIKLLVCPQCHSVFRKEIIKTLNEPFRCSKCDSLLVCESDSIKENRQKSELKKKLIEMEEYYSGQLKKKLKQQAKEIFSDIEKAYYTGSITNPDSPDFFDNKLKELKKKWIE